MKLFHPAAPAVAASGWSCATALAAATLSLSLWCLAAAAHAQGTASSRAPEPPVLQLGDYIAAVVNQESVTAFEVNQRVARVKEEAQRNRQALPPDAQLRAQALEALIEDRAILSYAREGGVKIDDNDIDRAVANIATQNQITVNQLRQRLAADGLDYTRFRANLRDQITIERVREREVLGRIRVTDAEIDEYLEKLRGAAAGEVEYNIAQILIGVPENAGDAAVAEKRRQAEAAMARVQKGEDFAKVAREVSEDGNREKGGELGLRPAERLPDLFLEYVRPLKAGEIAPRVARSGAGFHILKLVERRDAAAFRQTQTRARHILLRPSAQVPAQAAERNLREMKRQIESGARKFEDLAKQHSEDGSAPQGGDLGWVSPGGFVPEFEQAMNKLPVGGISDAVTSRFGVHLIQVMDRRDVALDGKQLREQAVGALRERKYEPTYQDWVKELRLRAYVEQREAPF